ncbi:MAG: STAS domain-containing protein [Acidimicrobiales bacterium]|jgi:anti-anti-sigma factor
MAQAGSSVFTVPRPVPRGSEPGPIVVWLAGEHDISTDGALCLALARAMASGPGALVIDLSGVEFMSASTLETIARARELLWHRSRSLTVRSPSAFVRRIIDACDLTDLLGPQAGNLAAKSLSSWVAVPATRRSRSQPGPLAPVPGRVPVPVGRTTTLRRPTLSAGQREEAT